jgi:serine/threonine protein kinase
VSKRLLVIDGPDQGKSFWLPDAGTVSIGNYHNKTDISLHDLYVAPVHCQVEVGDGRVTVSDRQTANGTLVNGAKIAQGEVQLGDVIRVGNSHLRLEEADGPPPAPAPPGNGNGQAPEPSGKLPRLPVERLGELSGRTVGHFEVGELLARGHTGIVFRARDQKSDQSVALKVLSPAFPASEEEMRTFIRAMKRRMAVNHRDLVGLRGVGKSGGYVWLAGELVEGDSLATVIRHWQTTRKNKWRLALRVALHLARALEAIHDHHLVHAAITPANVLMPAGDETARLNDLGLSDALAGSVLQHQVLERKFLAELPYLSPEHVDPEAPVDDLSDQYGVGAVVYGVLTGRPPAAGEAAEEVVAHIRTGVPARPKDFVRSVPDGFQAALLRTLAKRPEDRYPSPGQLRADLQAIAEEHDEDV